MPHAARAAALPRAPRLLSAAHSDQEPPPERSQQPHIPSQTTDTSFHLGDSLGTANSAQVTGKPTAPSERPHTCAVRFTKRKLKYSRKTDHVIHTLDSTVTVTSSDAGTSVQHNPPTVPASPPCGRPAGPLSTPEACPAGPRARAWRRTLEPERRSSPSHYTPCPIRPASVSPFWLTLYFPQQRLTHQVCQNAFVVRLPAHRPPSAKPHGFRHRARRKLLLTCAPGTLPRVACCRQCRWLSPPAFPVAAF